MRVIIGVGGSPGEVSELHLQGGVDDGGGLLYGKEEDCDIEKEGKQVSREGFGNDGFHKGILLHWVRLVTPGSPAHSAVPEPAMHRSSCEHGTFGPRKLEMLYPRIPLRDTGRADARQQAPTCTL